MARSGNSETITKHFFKIYQQTLTKDDKRILDGQTLLIKKTKEKTNHTQLREKKGKDLPAL